MSNGLIRDTTFSFRVDAFGFSGICSYFGDVSGHPPSAIVGSLQCGQTTTGTWHAHAAGPVAAITIEPADPKVVRGWGRPLKAVLRGAAGERQFYRSVTWASDNGAVALVSDSGFVSGVALGNATVTASAEQVNGQAILSVFPMDSFPITFDGEFGVEVMGADAALRSVLIPGGFLEPAWSPDGTKLALTRADTWFGCSIYTVRPDGSESVQLTTSYSCDHSAAWSPDGTKLAFGSGDLTCFDDCRVRIHVVNVDGSGNVPLLGSDFGWNTRPSWSPDGTEIAFEAWNASLSQSDIYVMDADGSGAVNLTNDSGYNNEPAWSRDGILAFVRDGDIWTMHGDGSGATNLTAGLAFESNPTWSPDGTRILFVSAPRNTCYAPDPGCWHLDSDLYVMHRDGSGVQRLPAGGFYVRNPAFRSTTP